MFISKQYTGLLCLFLFVAEAYAKVDEKCDPSDTSQDPPCSADTEQCDISKLSCVCLPEHTLENGVCTVPQATVNYSSLVDNQGSGSLAAGILIPLFLIVLVICSIYVGRRFELFKWLREKLNQRNRNYDEFMIGQDDDDDPPLV